MTKRVLLVDDDAGILDSVSLLLSEYGYEVQTSTDGNVIGRYAGALPDVILLDVWLSGWDGKDVCRTIKADDAMAHIPVLLMSAHKDIEKVAKDSGADGFIAKPFDIDILLEKVHSVVGA
jgi:DNA-binding response OmpR family regulator